MLGISRKVFDEFECFGITYCHWKSNEHLEEGLNGITDLDILVDHDNKKECENVLHRLKFLKVSAPLGNKYKYVDDWIGMDYDTGEMIHLHLHYKIVTGKQYRKEWVLPWSKMVLENRVKNEDFNVYMANPNMEIIILYVRVLLKAKYSEQHNDIIEVPNEYLKEIRYLKKVTDQKKIDFFLKKMLKGSEFKNCLFKESFTNKEYLYFKDILKSVLGKYRIESERQTYIRHKVLKFVVCIEKVLKKRNIPIITKKCPNDRGLIIAFIGTDGAGKSTMTKNIQSWLSWKIEIQQFYLGSGDGLRKPFVYKVYTDKNIPLEIRHWAGAGFYFYMSVYVKNKIRQIDAYRKHGGIAVLDRFPQLQYKGVNDGPKIDKLIEKSYFPKFLINRIIKIEEQNIRKAIEISPDIVFKLVIPPEEALRRKKENTLAEMKQKTAYIEGTEFKESTVYNIDASQNINKEMLEVKRIIWNEIYLRQLL